MSTMSMAQTSNSSWIGESPQRILVDFLTRESRRYVPFPYSDTCDAVFVNYWFEMNLFCPELNPQNKHTERLFELMRPDFRLAAVYGIKHLVVNRHTEHPETFRLRWSQQNQNSSEVFLVSCYGILDHVAVIPTAYIRSRYGETRCIEGVFEADQSCPTLLAPFMVRYQHLIRFLEEIYFYASTFDTRELANPTYSAIYHNWMPELQRLCELLPGYGLRDKLDTMQQLYFACKFTNETMRLSYKGEPGRFSLNGHPVSYWRSSWCRRGPHMIRVSLAHRLTVNSAWEFLLLENYRGSEAICLPRKFVPKHLIGDLGHGRRGTKWNCPQVEVEAGPWAPFTFAMSVGAFAAIISIVKTHSRGTKSSLQRSLGRDSGYESSTPRRTRSGIEDWIHGSAA